MSQQSKYDDMLSSEDDEVDKDSFEYMFKLTQQKNVRGLKRGIWCMPDIERTGSDAGKDKQWVCYHCVPPYHGAGWNATKCLAHLMKAKNAGCRPCNRKKSVHPEKLKVYAKLWSIYTMEVESRSTKRDVVDLDISSDHHSLVQAHVSSKKPKKSISNTSPGSLSTMSESPMLEVVPVVPGLGSKGVPKIKHLPAAFRKAGFGQPRTNSSTMSSTKSFASMQAPIFDKPITDANRKATMACAAVTHALGTPFNFWDDPLVLFACDRIRETKKSWKPPGREAVRGDLLLLNYNTKMEKNIAALKKESHIFGLSMSGDGAMIHKAPMFNVLAHGVHCPSCVLEVINCAGHLAKGGSKNAPYLAEGVIIVMRKLDPDRTIIYINWWDGASNVQLAGKIIEQIFPRCTSLWGYEHLCSLICKDDQLMPEVVVLTLWHYVLYNWFCSGSRQRIHAVFRKMSRLMNEGMYVGLDRHAGTRMAGVPIALLRDLRMWEVISMTCQDAELIALKEIPDAIRHCVADPVVKDCVHRYLIARYPLICLLRYTDQQKPAMGCVHFFVRRTRSLLEENRETIDQAGWTNKTSLRAYKRIATYFGGSRLKVPFKLIPSHEEKKLEVLPDVTKGDLGAFDEEPHDSGDVVEEQEEPVEGYKERLACSSGKKCMSFTDRLLLSFDNRLDHLVSDYSITAWILCPIAAVRVDANQNLTGPDRLRVERLVLKLLLEDADSQEEKDDCDAHLLIKFWEEYLSFDNKTGDIFDARRPCWRDTTKPPHLWHQLHALPHTEVLGRVGCIVLSKNLGTGGAERAWGGLGFLKDGQRSHLSPEQAKMQAFIMAGHSATKAQASRDHHQRCKSAAGMENNEFQFDWDEKDMRSGGLHKFGIDVQAEMNVARPIVYFRLWVEPWEDMIRHNNGPVAEAQLLKKYGGMRLWDEDNDEVLTINPDQMYFIKKRSRTINQFETGWQAVACKAGFDLTQDMDSNANKELWEPWSLSEEVVHDMIKVHDEKFPDKCIKLITKEEHEKTRKTAPPDNPSASSSSSSDDSDSSGSETTVGDSARETIQEEGSGKEGNVDINDSDEQEDVGVSVDEESRQDPTPEELDDQSRARPEDAGKEGGGRCFRCGRCFSALCLIVHQGRMFHTQQCLSKFKDSLEYPTPADADLTKHNALPGTPAGELRPTVLAFDSPPAGRSKTASKPKDQTLKKSASNKLKNKMSAAKSKAAKAAKKSSSAAGSKALMDCLDTEGADQTAK